MRQKTYNPVNRRRLSLLYIFVLLAVPSVGYASVLFNFDQNISCERISEKGTSSERIAECQGQDLFYPPINSSILSPMQHSPQFHDKSRARIIDDNPDDTVILSNRTSFIIHPGYIFFEAVVLFEPYHPIKSIFHPPPAVA